MFVRLGRGRPSSTMLPSAFCIFTSQQLVLDPLLGFCRGEDLEPAGSGQGEECFVSGDEHRGVAGFGQVQELLIVGILASRMIQPPGYLDPLGKRKIVAQQLFAIFHGQFEFRVRQRPEELLDRGSGNERPATGSGPGSAKPRDAAVLEQESRQHDIRVDHRTNRHRFRAHLVASLTAFSSIPNSSSFALTS